MEKLVYIALAIMIASGLGLCAGLWLFHTALNDGNVWKALVAAILILASGAYFTLAASALGGSR